MNSIPYGIVIGMGKSGQAVVAACRKKNIPFCAYDDSSESANLILKGEEGRSFLETFSFPEKSICIIAPGVKLSHPCVQICQNRHIEVMSEIEFAIRICQDKIPKMVGVTGTNGKTTVVSFITHTLQSENISCKAIGNIGVPVTEALLLEESHPEWAIVEVSSFQLMTTYTPLFLHGVCLNISPNHLDWHQSMEEYMAAKLHLKDLILEGGSFLFHESVLSHNGEKVILCPEFSARFPNRPPHAQHNFACAYALLQKIGISLDRALDHFETFVPPRHRLEYVGSANQVHFYNDSKSTNVAATEAAVAAISGKIVLIAGGVHKGSSYVPWKRSLSPKVVKIFAIGASAGQISKDVGEVIPVENVETMSEAVARAASFLPESYSVLLSPGCASYDMFTDYQHRGDMFVQAVKQLGAYEK